MLVLLLIITVPACAGETWSLEIFGGLAYSITTPLTIRQSGEKDISLDARYGTRPFESPLYYALRIGKWNGGHSWELELIHLKLFLENRPPEVQRFGVSHGYNLLTLNRGFRYHGFIYHLGAGIVITHPETTVRDKRLPEDGGILSRGYYISGPTVQIAAGRKFYLSKGLFAAVEGKVTTTYARILIQDGDADIPIIALHGIFGLGYDFRGTGNDGVKN